MKKGNYIVIIILFGVLMWLCTLMINQKEEVEYGVIEKVGDHLYEVTYDEYKNDYHTVRNYINNKYSGEKGACTAIYKDGMFMRNLDWYIKENGQDTPEIVIHTNANEGRYATIGVAYNNVVNDDNYNKLTDAQKKIVPYILTDGMNSEGLMYGQNVVPEIDEISDTFGTNPDGEKISWYMLGRQLLDNCADVDEAIDYIKNHNIFMVDEGNGYRMESHMLLADKERAVVIEFVDNKVVVLEQENLPYNETFITNHYLYNGGENTGHGMGYQRDEIVKENYDSVKDWQSGMKLLEKVKYSNSYTIPVGEKFWYSEYYVRTTINGKEIDFNKDTSPSDSTFLKYIEYLKSLYDEKDGSCWWSNHSSVYDTNDMSLHLAIREDYDNIYSFTLD